MRDYFYIFSHCCPGMFITLGWFYCISECLLLAVIPNYSCYNIRLRRSFFRSFIYSLSLIFSSVIYTSIKRTVQRDFLPPIFSQMDFSQAPHSVFKDFSNLTSNLRRYSRFLIDSPLLLIAESRYSLYCLIRRVATLLFIIAGSHYLLELSA
jgi:hypothetical protein